MRKKGTGAFRLLKEAPSYELLALTMLALTTRTSKWKDSPMLQKHASSEIMEAVSELDQEPERDELVSAVKSRETANAVDKGNQFEMKSMALVDESATSPTAGMQSKLGAHSPFCEVQIIAAITKQTSIHPHSDIGINVQGRTAGVVSPVTVDMHWESPTTVWKGLDLTDIPVDWPEAAALRWNPQPFPLAEADAENLITVDAASVLLSPIVLESLGLPTNLTHVVDEFDPETHLITSQNEAQTTLHLTMLASDEMNPRARIPCYVLYIITLHIVAGFCMVILLPTLCGCDVLPQALYDNNICFSVTSARRDHHPIYSPMPLSASSTASTAIGARIIDMLTSETYHHHERSDVTYLKRLLGLQAIDSYPPSVVLDSIFQSGHCWPMNRMSGYLGIELPTVKHILNITIGHVSPELADDIRAAPHSLIVWGMLENSNLQDPLTAHE
ncbi:uncharacterized protein LAESUDRAFT_718589 [Laetiporus sulphureus 93-53]|uniref:SUN domain-containing protein n=1 Tax=Laetiporus sulphureus 93-53 TaxID=1314785 RepID=A0A165ASM3_9APHY|nr:uncharacterized protein LAESUDRAFT_718589 [Laetiporus sulphureus 93-53]KZS99584.1 hypothetical protein LAESUDRAFT_718589 [Laetiporus sulphureus 93-53]